MQPLSQPLRLAHAGGLRNRLRGCVRAGARRNHLPWNVKIKQFSAASINDGSERPAGLVFDLPRRFTRREKLEVRDDIVDALAALPPPDKRDVTCPDELNLQSKIELISNRVGEVGLEYVLKLLKDAIANHERMSTQELRRALSENLSLGVVLRETFAQRNTISPSALHAGAYVSLWLVGPGTEKPAALASALLEQLGNVMLCLPSSDVSTLISAAARRDPPLPGAMQLLESLLTQLAERAPAELEEHELLMVLAALGDLGTHQIDPMAVEELLIALHDFWPLCTASTLLTALLQLGQATVLDVMTFQILVEQLGARIELINAADRESLLLLLALHKSAFDRARILPHPMFQEPAKKLIGVLAQDVSKRIPSAPIVDLIRPIVALAELFALSRQARLELNERLASARLHALPPNSFVSLMYAHRLASGPVPREELRQPFCLAFGALLHAMKPQQVLSCIQSLWRFNTKKNKHVFESAYGALARALETEDALLGPGDVASAISTYPRLRIEDSSVLVRILRSVAPEDRERERANLALPLPGSDRKRDRKIRAVSRGMLSWMNMEQLIDLLEAFGEQGMADCSAVAEAVVCRYEANGGRISRRNTARGLHALAQLGEQPCGLLDVFLVEVSGWMEQDPEAKHMSQRPAVMALWSLCALDVAFHTKTQVDWLLGFLCRPDQVTRVVNAKRKACMLFQSLTVVRHELPIVGMKYLQELQSTSSFVAGSDAQSLIGVDDVLQGPTELLALGQGGSPIPINLDDILDDAAESNKPAQSPVEIGNLGTDLAGKDLELSGEDADLEWAPPPGVRVDASTRSALDDLSLRWHLETRASQESVSKVKLIIGEVLAALNVGQLLRRSPHPKGALAAEATRLTGGFELRWEEGPYDVDWGHPHLRIGIIALLPRDFACKHDRIGLLARSRLRIHHLVRVQGWHLIILRASVLQDALQMGEDPSLLNHPVLEGRVRRANAVFPLESRRMVRQLRQQGNEAVLAEKLSNQLARQLELIFPDSVTSFGVQGSDP